MVEKYSFDDLYKLFEKKFKHEAMSVLHKLAADLEETPFGVYYEVVDNQFYKNDPAERVAIRQVGPEKFVKMRRRDVASVKISDHGNGKHPIQINSHRRGLDGILIDMFSELAKEKGYGEPFLWRI